MVLEAVLTYFLVFAVAFCTTCFLIPFVKKFALQYNIVDTPGSRRIHQQKTPRMGGVAVFIGFHLACALVFFTPGNNILPSVMDQNWWLLYLVVSFLVTGVGFLDDLLDIRPLLKLFAQIAAASVMYYAGVRVGIVVGFELPAPVDYLCTVLWFLAITNAFNLIDGMDGLASGLAGIASLGLIGSFLLRSIPGDALLIVAFLGACLGFLKYNFHPASIFLGDSGSMFLGFTLAAVALSTGSKGTVMASLGVPLLAVGVPIFDTMLAIWRRSVRKAFPEVHGNTQNGGVMHFDMDHLHHRLIRSGLNQRHAAFLLYLANAALVVVGLASLLFSSHAVGIFLIAFVVGTYVVIRHVAYVELWDSGAAIVQGVRSVSHPVLAVILYPIIDCILLGSALLISTIVCEITINPENLSNALYRWFYIGMPISCGISFIALFFSKTYSKVWSRSRPAEFVYLGFAIVAGVIINVAIQLMLFRGIPTQSFLLEQFLFCSLAISFLAGFRAMPGAVHDLMSVEKDPVPEEEEKRLLVYGAGGRGLLYLKNRFADHVPPRRTAERVIGFVDDDRNLRNRVVHGYKVIGGLRDLTRMLQRGEVDEVVLASNLPEKRIARLISLAQKYGARVVEWKPISTCLVESPQLNDLSLAILKEYPTPEALITSEEEKKALVKPASVVNG